jgi:hypothetical protein
MREDHWTSFKESGEHHQKLIWFYVREINYGDDFLDKATYGEMQEQKKDLHRVLIDPKRPWQSD